MAEDEDGKENLIKKRLTTPLSSKSDEDIEEIIISKRIARSELVLRFLSLVCLSLMLGLFVIQLEIAWRSRELLLELGIDPDARHFSYPDFYLDPQNIALLLELGIDPDARHFSYPDFYLDPHNEEHWCWNPDTMELKVNTSLFVR